MERMDVTMYPLVKELCELFGPSNYEEDVQDYLKKRWAPHVERMHSDALGNLMAHWGGEGPRVLIGAHADQIGMLVSVISDEGMVWLSPISGSPRLLNFAYKGILGRPARVRTEEGREIWGVIASVTGHIETDAQSSGPVSWDDLYLDLGATSREEVEELGVFPGCPVMWQVTTTRFRNHIVTSGVDDRVGLAIMTQLLEELPVEELAYEVHFVSTVQEEVGLVGAAPPVRGGDFDFAIALDVGLASDIPFVEEKRLRSHLGQGPQLVYKDGSVHYDKKTLNRLADVARQCGIPVQRAVFHKFSSDGVIWIKEGLPTALMAWPTRYTHSPFEMIHERDLRYCVDLLKAFLTTPE